VHTGLSWTLSPLWSAEAKPNLSQLYLSRLSLANPAKLNFFKTPASVYLSLADGSDLKEVVKGAGVGRPQGDNHTEGHQPLIKQAALVGFFSQ
jgi:hypothetical protein